MVIIKLMPYKRSILLVIAVLLLSAVEAQLHKIPAIVAPRYDFGVESSKDERKVSI